MKIAIVEDNSGIAGFLKEALETNNFTVHVFYNGVDALNNIYKGDYIPELILMDVNLPDISGIELTSIIKSKYPDTDIIAQTINESPDTIISVIKAGASGYLLKGASTRELLFAIETVKDGGSFITSRVAQKILIEFEALQKLPGVAGENPESKITERESEILRELVKGGSYKKIAQICNISPNTVGSHIRNIYKKLQVNSKTEAAAKVKKL